MSPLVATLLPTPRRPPCAEPLTPLSLRCQRSSAATPLPPTAAAAAAAAFPVLWGVASLLPHRRTAGKDSCHRALVDQRRAASAPVGSYARKGIERVKLEFSSFESLTVTSPLPFLCTARGGPSPYAETNKTPTRAARHARRAVHPLYTSS